MKRKILHVVAYFPPSLGGMEKVAEYVAVEHAKLGNDVEVVTSDSGYDSSYVDKKIRGYRVSRLRTTVLFNVPIIWGLFTHLLRQPASSVVHMHIAQAFVPEVALLAAKLRRCTFVAHFHLDVVASGRFGGIFTLYKKSLFSFMLRHADKIIVFSQDQQDLVVRKYNVVRDRVLIIPNGVGSEYFNTDKKRLHTPPRLLFVGRLGYQKNIKMLLSSLDGISDKFETRLVGSGELEKELKAQARTLRLQNVTFVGRKDGEDLLREYKQADIFVLPSDREGMPLVLLEAMAMRLPVIGTNVLGTKDVVKHDYNGYLVELNDTQAMAEAIIELSKKQKIYQLMSDNAYEYVQDYAWPKIAGVILKAYNLK